jgi:hypothetical protein
MFTEKGQKSISINGNTGINAQAAYAFKQNWAATFNPRPCWYEGQAKSAGYQQEIRGAKHKMTK